MSAPNATTPTPKPKPKTGGFKMPASKTPVGETPRLFFGDFPAEESPKHATGGAAAPARETVNLVPATESVKLAPATAPTRKTGGAAAPATESVKLASAAAPTRKTGGAAAPAPGKVIATCSVCMNQVSMKRDVVEDRKQRSLPLFCFPCHSAGAAGAAAGAPKAPRTAFCKHCQLNDIDTPTTGKNLCPMHLGSCQAEEKQRVRLTSDPVQRGFIKSCLNNLTEEKMSREAFFVTLSTRTEHSENHASSTELIALFRACVAPANRLDGVRSGQIITCLEGDLAKPLP